jgi:hypothetical protein
MYRRFAISKRSLPIIQVYGFPYPTSPVRSLQRVSSMMNGRKSLFLLRSSADILALQRMPSSGQMHLSNMPLPLRLRSERGQQHLPKRSLQAMKQCSLSRRREQRSAQIVTLITRKNHQLRASHTRPTNNSIKQIPSRFSCRVVTRQRLSPNALVSAGYSVCLSCNSRRRDALCISISFIVPLPLIIFPVSSLKL